MDVAAATTTTLVFKNCSFVELIQVELGHESKWGFQAFHIAKATVPEHLVALKPATEICSASSLLH